MDLEMLRRDEIWLTELDVSHATKLSTVLRSSARKRENMAKGYLRGRYGAIPDIQHEHHLLTLKAKKAEALTRGQAKFAT